MVILAHTAVSVDGTVKTIKNYHHQQQLYVEEEEKSQHTAICNTSPPLSPPMRPPQCLHRRQTTPNPLTRNSSKRQAWLTNNRRVQYVHQPPLRDREHQTDNHTHQQPGELTLTSSIIGAPGVKSCVTTEMSWTSSALPIAFRSRLLIAWVHPTL